MTEGSDVFEGRVPTMVRTQLAELVAANGAEILNDPRRVRAMLNDTASTAVREINLINLALSEGVPERLLVVAGDPLRLEADITNLVRQLERNNALHHDAAEWAVRSCAWSLGLTTAPDDLEPPAPTPAPPTPGPETRELRPEPEPEPVPVPQLEPRPISDPPMQPETALPPPRAPAPTPERNESPSPKPRSTSSTMRPKLRPVVLVLAALVLIAIVVAIAVAASGGKSGDGSTPSVGEGKDFTAEDRKLMSAVPEIAPRNSCGTEPRQLYCDATKAVRVTYESGSQADAEAWAFRDAPTGTTPASWNTPSGQTGGKVATWKEQGESLAGTYKLGFTFRLGDTYYGGTAYAAGLADELMTWFRANVITSGALESQ